MIITICTQEHYESVIRLFADNYDNYQYHIFKNVDALNQAILQGLKGWVAIIDNKVVGFAGLYINKDVSKLAHLLVDKNYRGLNIGTELEKCREKYYENMDIIVLASCVETPIYSVLLKIKHSFHCIGIRLNYRINVNSGSNSIMMLKALCNYNQKYLNFELPLDATLKLIKEVCNKFEVKINCIEYSKYNVSIDDMIIEKENENKAVVEFKQVKKFSSNGIALSEIKSSLDFNDKQYISVKIFLCQKGFSSIDRFLHQMGFHPIVVYLEKNLDATIIEYQYMNSDMVNTYFNLIKKIREMEDNNENRSLLRTI